MQTLCDNTLNHHCNSVCNQCPYGVVVFRNEIVIVKCVFLIQITINCRPLRYSKYDAIGQKYGNRDADVCKSTERKKSFEPVG